MKRGLPGSSVADHSYGVQGNTMGFPLTINVHQSVLDSVVSDIVRSLEHQGVMRLLILNGHGGNDFKPLLRFLYGETKVFVSLADWWKVGNDAVAEIFENDGEHADELETSVDLALIGDLVHLENAGDGSVHKSRFEAINKGWASIARQRRLFTKVSTVGDPQKSTNAKREMYVQQAVDSSATMSQILKRAGSINEEGYSVIVRANNVLPKETDSFSSMNVCRSF